MDSSRTVRGLVALALLVCATPSVFAAGAANKVSLRPHHEARELRRIEIALQVGGDLKLVTDSKEKQLPMSVVANLKYDEQLLAFNASGNPTRSIRYYDDTRAAIKVDKGGERPSLGKERRLIVVEQVDKNAAELYCPTAALGREELDLIDVPGNTLVIDQLLPTEPVAIGEPWKHTDETMAALVGVEAVSWTDVQSVVGEIKDGVAEIAAAGSISGAVGGVSTEIELKAKYKFDLKRRTIFYLALLIKEKRVVGHIGPGLDTVAKVLIKLEPLPTSEHLTPAVLEKLPKKMNPDLARLSYTASSNLFRFDYDRRWYLTSDDNKLAVFRFLDRGELVAQCNISALPTGKEKPVSLAEFQQDVRDSLGKNFGQFVNASQSINDAGYTVFRVVVHGVVSELPIEWVYYLVAGPKGQRISLAFTLEENLQERFAQADRIMVRELRLAEPPTPTAAKPVKPAEQTKHK